MLTDKTATISSKKVFVLVITVYFCAFCSFSVCVCGGMCGVEAVHGALDALCGKAFDGFCGLLDARLDLFELFVVETSEHIVYLVAFGKVFADAAA